MVIVMKKFLSSVVFASDILFFVLWAHIITSSRDLTLNSVFILISLIVVVFLKALTVNEQTKAIAFDAKEFLKLFFTENLIKFVIVMAFMLWFNKIISGLGGFLLVLASFVIYGLCVYLYYWLQRKHKVKQLEE